jgi:hypothetical protein
VSAPVRLPRPDGSLLSHTPGGAATWQRPDRPSTARIAYAAAHVAADPFADNTPGAPSTVDWDPTLAFRRHLWDFGLGVAEAMDTAQRGMGLDWPATRELIGRSSAAARECGGRIAAGAGTDHAVGLASIDEIVTAYEQQVEFVEGAGARVILMASRALAAIGRGPEDYAKVYGRLLDQVREPAIVHWLGPMFDPALDGYWGSADVESATATFAAIVAEHASKVDGVKVSLLNAAHEVWLRELLPEGVRVYTGDDFHYPELIRGDGARHSDALLGVFAAIAPMASAALQALDRGDVRRYDDILGATVPLARHLFGAPTYNYKTGIAFLAWLSGHQPGFAMVGGLQSGRSAVHLAQAYRMADELGLFPDPELAAVRMRAYLTVAGIAA